ncbi:FecR domain-containing protein [Methylophaga nitratireducenticrescens]|uniref:FecR n=1 Tax=Methylophaga nitratireducenticrescens TaxID=754476 RepID=I1XMM6_METNJ|nr:FecR family protein [Methylophaga nitratireducenticrescens]AFI85645.1 iron dicitrate transport regulator FecR [Methylophaga nitratireducenticrescens]AUZ85373.1 iron dicitrate transport regulator FecR [Methylophaga nitratireducenticrescens]
MFEKNLGEQPTSKQSIKQACEWMARLWADDATEKDHLACQEWRAAATENEQAWLKVQQLQQRFQVVPDPEVGSKLLRQHKSVSRRQFISYGGLGIGLGVLGTGYFTSMAINSTDYATHTGEIQNLALADGTRLFLNTTTRLDINYDQNKREILLHEGEVYIETSPNPLPLTVVSREGVLRPLGTRFTVRVMSEQVQLAVYQGRVQIQPAQSSSTNVIDSGLGADFNRFGFIKDFAADASDIAWTAHKLAVANMPLNKFVEELSRYRPGVLRASPELTSLTVTGVFSLYDTDRILKQLTEVLPVRLQTYTSYWVNILPV